MYKCAIMLFPLCFIFINSLIMQKIQKQQLNIFKLLVKRLIYTDNIF